MQKELREFAAQASRRLTAVRQWIAHNRQTSQSTLADKCISLPLRISQHSEAQADDTAEWHQFETNLVAASELRSAVADASTSPRLGATELDPTSIATQRLEAIKQRLSDQIQKS